MAPTSLRAWAHRDSRGIAWRDEVGLSYLASTRVREGTVVTGAAVPAVAPDPRRQDNVGGYRSPSRYGLPLWPTTRRSGGTLGRTLPTADVIRRSLPVLPPA